MTKLKEYVQNWIDENGIESAQNVLQHGCVSGCVSELVYYSDTLPFFARHKEEINEILSEQMEGCGCDSPAELFGDEWDKTDSICIETNNQNLLAWFAFEETLRAIIEDQE